MQNNRMHVGVGERGNEVMNVENLHVGMIVNNYKELCRLLGVKHALGDSKVAQIKMCERYFRFERDGRKFIITEIYETPSAPLVENRKYAKYIEYLLICEISQKEGYSCSYTKSELLSSLGMISNKFSHGITEDMQRLIDEQRIPQWQVRKFMARSRKKMYDILDSALESMVKRGLLVAVKQWIIVEHTKGWETHRSADGLEPMEIQDIENEVLDVMGRKKIPFWEAGREEFFSRVNEKVQEKYGRKRGWMRVYKALNLKLVAGQIPNIIAELQGQLDDRTALIEQNRIELNKRVIDVINKDAEKLYEKQKNRFNVKGFFGEAAPIKITMDMEEAEDRELYPEDFVKNQHWLSEFFLRI